MLATLETHHALSGVSGMRGTRRVASMEDDPGATVRALLAAAGIAPPADEVEKMIQAYPALRAAADSLYTDEIAGFAPAFLPTDEEREAR